LKRAGFGGRMAAEPDFITLMSTFSFFPFHTLSVPLFSVSQGEKSHFTEPHRFYGTIYFGKSLFGTAESIK